ncbi:MAG: hypothetical protein OXF73_13145 [Gammaproteobacteria bacterium]|nr:hypothetical protein [Gammaproteobacteria bacterium]MCY4228444.1 hypothetical protein [Gammaproteobacteria bacterium]
MSTQAYHARETGIALELHCRFLLWLIPAVDRFPRSQKFLLGDRIQCMAIDVLEAPIESNYSKPDKSSMACPTATTRQDTRMKPPPNSSTSLQTASRSQPNEVYRALF